MRFKRLEPCLRSLQELPRKKEMRFAENAFVLRMALVAQPLYGFSFLEKNRFPVPRDEFARPLHLLDPFGDA